LRAGWGVKSGKHVEWDNIGKKNCRGEIRKKGLGS